jgi:U3 small nucleolar RNA-associated protein 14
MYFQAKKLERIKNIKSKTYRKRLKRELEKKEGMTQEEVKKTLKKSWKYWIQRKQQRDY